jgi:hypothetical protein
MGENRDRARQTKFNEKQLCRTTSVATGAVNLARWKQESAHGSVNVHLHTSFVALHHRMIGVGRCSLDCALHPPDQGVSY